MTLFDEFLPVTNPNKRETILKGNKIVKNFNGMKLFCMHVRCRLCCCCLSWLYLRAFIWRRVLWEIRRKFRKRFACSFRCHTWDNTLDRLLLLLVLCDAFLSAELSSRRVRL